MVINFWKNVEAKTLKVWTWGPSSILLKAKRNNEKKKKKNDKWGDFESYCRKNILAFIF